MSADLPHGHNKPVMMRKLFLKNAYFTLSILPSCGQSAKLSGAGTELTYAVYRSALLRNFGWPSRYCRFSICPWIIYM